MTNEFANVPATRNWRDIPQPVKPRAMSRGGRRRRMTAGMRTGMVAVFVVAIACGGWMLTGALQPKPQHVPAAVKATPVRPPELKTNGGIGHEGLVRRLALPKGASLMELDLEQLRARLLADSQIMAATLTRNFPDRLLVGLTERSPVARIMAELKGVQQPLLVARDGVIFAGEGFEPAMIAGLPWLDGITLARQDGRFLPIEGMDVVTEFLARAREATPRTAAEDPRRTWKVISLARLAMDRELEARTVEGITVVFATNRDFFQQLAKLDLIWDWLASAPGTPARIDLTLGREVPVMVEASPAQPAATAEFLPFQSTNRREL